MPWPTIFRGTSVDRTRGIRPRPEDGLDEKSDAIRKLINQGGIAGPEKEPTDSYVDSFGNTVHLDPVDVDVGQYSPQENRRRMSLTADERLREDRRTASGPTGLPPMIGTSPKDLVAKYYAGIEGGVDEAVNAAQSAMNTPTRDSKFENPLAYNKWTPDRIEKVYEVRTYPLKEDMTTRGQYWPKDDYIELGVPNKSDKNTDRRGNYRSVLQHESTHAYTNNPFDDIVRINRKPSMRPISSNLFETDDTEAGVSPSLGLLSMTGASPSFREYLNRPTEADARLAEIKREYAHATNVLVRTPEDADAAMNWFKDSAELIKQGRGNRPYNTGAERTLPGSLSPRVGTDPQFYEYLHPEYQQGGERDEQDPEKFDRDTKIYQQYMRRMPELVRSEKNYIGTKAT